MTIEAGASIRRSIPTRSCRCFRSAVSQRLSAENRQPSEGAFHRTVVTILGGMESCVLGP